MSLGMNHTERTILSVFIFIAFVLSIVYIRNHIIKSGGLAKSIMKFGDVITWIKFITFILFLIFLFYLSSKHEDDEEDDTE
jgi:preprotein translocase subunit SecG